MRKLTSCTYAANPPEVQNLWLIAKVLLRGLKAYKTKISVHFNGLELLARSFELRAGFEAAQRIVQDVSKDILPLDFNRENHLNFTDFYTPSWGLYLFYDKSLLNL